MPTRRQVVCILGAVVFMWGLIWGVFFPCCLWAAAGGLLVGWIAAQEEE